MKYKFLLTAIFCGLFTPVFAEVSIDERKLGDLLGGWKQKNKMAAEYPLSGSRYRTYRPEISPTPNGGLFISLRIDHVRGWLSTDDYAVLEITVNRLGKITSARSSIAIQGRSVTSDLIRSGLDAGKSAVGMDRAVQIGTDLIADISQKMLREKIVEAGRVSFPAALRHNYNLLYQAIRYQKPAPPEPATAVPPPPAPATEAPVATPISEKPVTEEVEADKKAKKIKPLDIQSYETGKQPTLPTQEKE